MLCIERQPMRTTLNLDHEALASAMRPKGRTVRSTIDCLIAALAEENDCHVLACDRDLRTILGSGLVRAGLWPFDSAAPRIP
jgi:predicted nucleic acid-binding protein